MCSLLSQPEGTLTPYPTVSHCPIPGERPQCQYPPEWMGVPDGAGDSEGHFSTCLAHLRLIY